MRQIAFLLVAVATLGSIIAYMVPASGQATQNSAPLRDQHSVRIP
jgi:hypothetical protein